MKAIILFLVLIMFFGCNSKINTTYETKIKELRDSINKLNENVSKLTVVMEYLKDKIDV